MDNSKPQQPRQVKVQHDDLVELFCDVNNFFVNIRQSVFASKNVGSSKVLQARQASLKGRLANILNTCNEVEVLGSEHHPIKMRPEQIKKILAKARG